MEIRTSYINDFEEIYNLFTQLWPNKELHKKDLLKVFERGLTADTDYYLSAVENGKVIGFSAFYIANNFWQEGIIAYDYGMIVDEKNRGQGIGKSLIDTACQIAKELGCKRFELDSGFQREDAHKFYESIGFEKRAYLFSKIL
ncbi:GNAT family N-acetyltransferase [Clostridium sp.]|uniref:GNAT family N-acetyltransferase n=1 Tax=Clostridium sp. TaxID=1506 RepID=UPI00262E2336|nr:GNAT family N-acetyltransferase [Clostridium sp.]